MKKIFKLYNSIPGVVVLIMILLPFVANMFVSNTQLMDNRPLNTKPTKFTRSFAKDYEAYYNDTFAGRKSLVKRYLKLQNKLKIDSGKFFHGEGGWMFYDSAKAGDGNSIIDYKGEVLFSDNELKEMQDGITKAKDFYAKHGVKYVVFVATNKEEVYPEYMPSNLRKTRKSEHSRVDVAVDYINSHSSLHIVNIKDELLSNKDEFGYLLYYMKDTHWNAIGAYIGYNEILKSLDIKPQILSKNMIKERSKINVDMDSSSREMAYDISYLDNVKATQVASIDDDKIMVFEAPNAPVNQTILLIRDSFTADLIPFISRKFKKSVFVHNSSKAHENMENYLKEYKPNIVVDEIVERGFDKFLKYSNFYGSK